MATVLEDSESVDWESVDLESVVMVSEDLE